jgi:hypothetical protein
MPEQIFQLKVTLLGTDPPIWRRLLVPAGATLESLHRVLQIAVGWDDCHMHEFAIGRQRFGAPGPMDDFGGPPVVSERNIALGQLLTRPRSKLRYTYDFGDSWEHEIVLEKILPPEPNRAYPSCVAGERQGPPEDCGGLPGFYNLLDAIADPKHPDHEDTKEWAGDFDPDAFSIDEVNRRLARIRPKKTRRK